MPRSYRKKKKTYTSKLKDKKINTTVERRMKEIADKEIQKNFQWLYPQKLMGDDDFDWIAHGPNLRIPSNSMMGVNAGTLWHDRISDFGNLVVNDQIDKGQSDDPWANNIIVCKNVKCRFEFRHTGAVPIKIGIFLVFVPSAEMVEDASLPVPVITMLPGGGLNGLNSFRPNSGREVTGYDYRILAKKFITIEPTIQYTSPKLNTSTKDGQITTYVSSTSTHTENSKVVFLNHTFKGDGKEFQVVHSDPAADGATQSVGDNMYICCVADGVMVLNSIACQKIRVQRIRDTAQPTFVNYVPPS